MGTGPRALGGVSFALALNSSAVASFSLLQDIGRGVVSWNVSLAPGIGRPAAVLAAAGWVTVSQDGGVSSQDGQ